MRVFFILIVLLSPFRAFCSTFWAELREKSQLTNQTSKTKRDDLCGAAAAVNLAQGLAKQLKRPTLENPHALFESVVENYPGVNDDIGLREVSAVLRTVMERVLPQEKLKIEALLLDYYTEKNMENILSVERLTEANLTPKQNEAKILFIGLFDARGNFIGSHAVVVESLVEGQLKFINSFEPQADSRAKIYANIGSTWKGYQIPTFRILSPKPTQLSAPHAFMVRGVLTVLKAD